MCAGAPEILREKFVYAMQRGAKEFRIGGFLGFGGKYWPGTNTVSCYSEDMTHDREVIVSITNAQLSDLAIAIIAPPVLLGLQSLQAGEGSGQAETVYPERKQTMSPDAQRITIAEACGWKYNVHLCVGAVPHDPATKQYCKAYHCPDYLNDLNAMHEAEKVLSSGECAKYRDALKLNTAIYGDMDGGCIDWQLVHATAAQRAEAFLRTLNLWIDETTPHVQ